MYRHHRMQQEYEYRREVLERTGIVLVDKGCIPLPQNEMQRLALGGQVVEAKALPPMLDAETGSAAATGAHATPVNHDDDVTDAEIISPEAAGTANRADSAEDAAQAPGGQATVVDATAANGTGVKSPGANCTGADSAHKPQNQA